jgi:hypothetical protein
MHSPERRVVHLWLFVAALLCGTPLPPRTLEGQTPAQPSTPSVSVSGVVFGNYQYHLSGQSREFNQFLLERAYVTLRASLAERMSVRVTTDVFQSGDQNGWTVRAKYAYLQYDVRKGPAWNTFVRAGMLHNVVVEHEEQVWPRFVSSVAIERSGGFASADVGLAGQITFPSRWGEVYAHVINGPGFTRRESDRFKDYGVRLSLTPLAGRINGLLSTLVISPWIYEGATASRFVSGGGGGAIAPIGEGLPRDRFGVFTGLRDPRLTAGVQVARMRTVTDTLGAGPLPSRVVRDADANLLSAHGIVRPLAFARPDGRSPFGILIRYDAVESDVDRDDRYHFFIAGLLFDVNARSTLVLDYQEQLANDGAPPLPSPGSFRALFAHINVNF